MNADRWNATLRSLQSHGRLPSVVAAVARSGTPVWTGVAGATPAATPLTAYRIGSITKTMTAVLILQACDDGLVSLDSPIGGLVPAGDYSSATLRELLSHTAGLQSEPDGLWWERVEGGGLEELLAANDGRARVADAGTLFHYSNLGFALLGEAASRLRGRDWWGLVRERLLAPLGMTETTYAAPPGCAQGMSVDHFASTLTREPHTDTGAMAAAGQLWSTAADLLRWADSLAIGHPDVLPAVALKQMRTPVAPGSEYGLGLRTTTVGTQTLVGHMGAMPGFQASLYVDPVTRDAVAVMANSTTGLPSALVPALFLGSEVPPPTTTPEPWHPTVEVPRLVQPLLGVWFWGNTAYGCEWHGDRIVLRDLRTAVEEEALHVRGDRIVGVAGYHDREELRVHRGVDGRITHLECATFVYTRAPYGASVP